MPFATDETLELLGGLREEHLDPRHGNRARGHSISQQEGVMWAVDHVEYKTPGWYCPFR